MEGRTEVLHAMVVLERFDFSTLHDYSDEVWALSDVHKALLDLKLSIPGWVRRAYTMHLVIDHSSPLSKSAAKILTAIMKEEGETQRVFAAITAPKVLSHLSEDAVISGVSKHRNLMPPVWYDAGSQAFNTPAGSSYTLTLSSSVEDAPETLEMD